MGRVAEKVKNVLDRTFSCYSSLRVEAQPRHHSQPPVLNFLHLEILERGGILGKAERIEKCTARVIDVSGQEYSQGLQRLDAAVPCVLGTDHQKNLAEGDHQHSLRPGDMQTRNSEVVQSFALQLCVAHPPPNWFAEAQAAVSDQELGNDCAHGSQHRPSCVEDFKVEKFVEICGFSAQSENVKSVVARGFA
ncbi:hypothetical protein Mapa_008094 [Marchantia paleacea]|nr:hypothetical protein Mapa_008094 [Marchantia paleacea]